MTLTSRPAALLVAVCAAMCLGACATGSEERASKGRAASGFTVGAAQWMSPTSETGDADPAGRGPSPVVRNYALERHDPWLGGIGFRQWIADSAEFGLGLALPKPSGSDARSAATGDASRVGAGVGLWLTLDF